MNTSTHAHQPVVTLFTLKLVWGALLISQLFYLGTVFQLKREIIVHVAGTPWHPLFFPFVIAAGVALLLALLLPPFLLRSKKGTLTNEAPLSSWVATAFFPYVLRLIFLEAVTVTGFIAVIATKSPPDLLYPFFTISMIGFVLQLPTENKVRSLLSL